jgi:hypothetical protein
MSGGLPDLEHVRSRIVTELERLRLWAEDAPQASLPPEHAIAAGAIAQGDDLPQTVEAAPPRLETLTPPLPEFALHPEALAAFTPQPIGMIATAPAPPETATRAEGDTRLEAAVSQLLDMAPGGLGNPGSTASLVILNAAFIPGWPFPDALVRATLPAPAALPALAALGAGLSTMSEAERTAYLAQLGLPFQLPARLRTLIDRLFDGTTSRGLLLALLETLSVLAEGLAQFEAELGAHRAARDRLAAARPRHPGGKTRVIV